jgi:hypothetical protein
MHAILGEKKRGPLLILSPYQKLSRNSPKALYGMLSKSEVDLIALGPVGMFIPNASSNQPEQRSWSILYGYSGGHIRLLSAG